MISYQPGTRLVAIDSVCGDIMVLVGPIILQDHVTKGSR